MVALILVAMSVGLSNLAAAIGLGVSGVGPRTRLRVVIIFGIFEAGMPVLGLVIGHVVASSIGHGANRLAGALLVAVGCLGIVTGVRGRAAADRQQVRSDRHELLTLLVTGFALSLDNLIVGFALGSYRVRVLVGALVFGLVSAAMSLAGLEFGVRIGKRVGESGQIFGGVVMTGVGLAIGLGAFG